MNVLLFTNNGFANAACAQIDNNIRAMARQQGYEAGPSGVTGKNFYNVSMPGNQKQVNWDLPHPVGTGTVSDPQAKFWAYDPRPTYGEAILDGVKNWTEGTYEYPPSEA